MGEFDRFSAAHLLEACGFRFSAEQLRAEEARVLLRSAQLLPSLLGPSDVYNLLLLVTGADKAPAELREFLEKICLFEMWEGGPDRPACFVLGLAALVVYLEIAGDFVLLRKVLSLVHFDWSEHFRALYPRIEECRKKLFLTAKKLSKDSASCGKISGLQAYDFGYLVARLLRPFGDPKKGKLRK